MAIEKLETLFPDMLDRDAQGRFVAGNQFRAGKGNQRARKYSKEAQEKMQAVELADDGDRDAQGRFVAGNRHRFERGNELARGFGNLAWNRVKDFPRDAFDREFWRLSYEKRKLAYSLLADYRTCARAYNALHRRMIKADIAEVGESNFDAIVESMHKTARRVLPERMHLENALWENGQILPVKLKKRIQWLLHSFERLEIEWVKDAPQSTQGFEIRAGQNVVDTT